MKVLKAVKPSKEQLTVIVNNKPGPFVVRGAAGSGKTTTALYRLKFTVKFWQRRHQDGHLTGPVQVRVLTYNKTLRGYIEALAEDEITGNDVSMVISTFGKWVYSCFGGDDLVSDSDRTAKLVELCQPLGLPETFLLSEVEYVLGRFLPGSLDEYLDCERTGRGRVPAVPRALRERILREVIEPFATWKKSRGQFDWGDYAVKLALEVHDKPYHVIVIDEAQDFSANQVRAVLNHLHPEHTITFVLDAAQRIYPQRFTWAEVGLSIGSNNSRLLSANFRNSRQIASFAAPLLSHIESTDDLAVPDPDSCTQEGPKPLLVRGRFKNQLAYVIDFLNTLDPDDNDSVAILHAKGGGWFSDVRDALSRAGLAYVDIAGNSEWPTGPTNIALSTLHSAKGLEFDHVIIVGLNGETMPHGTEPGDSQRDSHIRLLAMAAGRARKTLTVTYKPTEASDLIACLDSDTYDVKDV